MSGPLGYSPARRLAPPRREERRVAPHRFGDELDGPFSANLMRQQFDHLFRQFGR